ncbi:MAG: hypothetical protein ACLPVY_15370 [Acidimicrobiia bacterium]
MDERSVEAAELDVACLASLVEESRHSRPGFQVAETAPEHGSSMSSPSVGSGSAAATKGRSSPAGSARFSYPQCAAVTAS